MAKPEVYLHPYHGPERREVPRLTLDTIVNISRSEKDFFFDFALNFSPRGFFFETSHTLELQQPVNILFPLPMETWVYAAVAIPLWHFKNPDEDDYDAHPDGYGFKIVSFEKEDDQTHIETYFKHPPDFSKIAQDV